MIEALAPNGTYHPLHVRSLPRRTRRGQHFVDAQVSQLFSEVIAEDRIAVPQQVARELVKGKCVPQLLSRPLGGRVGSHIAVQNPLLSLKWERGKAAGLPSDCWRLAYCFVICAAGCTGDAFGFVVCATTGFGCQKSGAAAITSGAGRLSSAENR